MCTGKGELFTYWLSGKDDYDRPLPEWDPEDGPSHGLKIDDYLNVSRKVFNFCKRTLKHRIGRATTSTGSANQTEAIYSIKEKIQTTGTVIDLRCFWLKTCRNTTSIVNRERK